MATLFEPGLIPAFDSNGRVISGAQLHFYHSGTSTRVPVFTAPDETVAHPNPVPANSAGRFPPIYLRDTVQHRVRLTDAAGVLLPLCEVDPLNIYRPAVPTVRYYRFGGFAVQTPLGGEVLVEHVVTDAFTLPADMVGSVGNVGAPPAAIWTMTVQCDDVPIGSIDVHPSGAVHFYTGNRVPVPIAEGAVVSFVAQAEPDPIIARLRWTLKGTL